jgi:hypothetical protein
MDKPFAITLDPGSSLANKTGSWRTERPVYVDRLPPCNAQCPAGEDIQGWLYHAEGGDYEAAWRHLTRDNPFPAIMGRVCYHSCEGACNRGQVDAAVGINSVERFPGRRGAQARLALRRQPPRRKRGKHVLVVGAGPSGMSAAYHLRRLGHAVTVAGAGPLMGGMMRFGIPKYRLPREVLDAEMQRIVAMGVTLQLNTKVDDLAQAMKSTAATTPPSWPWARTSPNAPSSRPRTARASWTRCRCCAAWKARTSRCWAAAWWSTAAATPPSTWRAPPSGWAPPRPSSSTAARARRCPRTTSRSKRRCRKA